MNKLKFLRAQKNITQDQIAKDLFINQKTYSRYETGVSEPDHETLKKLANYFNVRYSSMSELLTFHVPTKRGRKKKNRKSCKRKPREISQAYSME